jgi:hypothetical protein
MHLHCAREARSAMVAARPPAGVAGCLQRISHVAPGQCHAFKILPVIKVPVTNIEAALLSAFLHCSVIGGGQGEGGAGQPER